MCVCLQYQSAHFALDLLVFDTNTLHFRSQNIRKHYRNVFDVRSHFSVFLVATFPYYTFDINKPIDFHATDRRRKKQNVHTQNFMSFFVRYIITFRCFQVNSIYVCAPTFWNWCILYENMTSA